MVSAMIRPCPLTAAASGMRLDRPEGNADRPSARPGRRRLLLLGLVATVPAAAGVQPVPAPLEFDIAREGDVVGHHRIDFRRDGDRLVVRSDLKIEVEMLSFTVYRYQQSREEVWRDGKLIALAATADDDGTPHDIKGSAGRTANSG
jgi:hypothetical protein